jgi:hypothetical protein
VSGPDGVVVEASGSEEDPRILSRELDRYPHMDWWSYQGVNFTQYWRQPKPVDAGLEAVVNARAVYYGQTIPIPGGKAFENFELNAPFHPGQVFIYGVRPPEPGAHVRPEHPAAMSAEGSRKDGAAK